MEDNLSAESESAGLPSEDLRTSASVSLRQQRPCGPGQGTPLSSGYDCHRLLRKFMHVCTTCHGSPLLAGNLCDVPNKKMEHVFTPVNLHKGAAHANLLAPHGFSGTWGRGKWVSRTSAEAAGSASPSGGPCGQGSGRCFSGNLQRISVFGTSCPSTAFQGTEDMPSWPARIRGAAPFRRGSQCGSC